MTVSAGGRMRVTSCGVVITDANRLVLLGQATGSARWDIPKGIADPGEEFAAAAAREVAEETGLVVDAASLTELGVFRYLPAKDLALFSWRVERVDVAGLRCRSTFEARDGRILPEFARFAMVQWADALDRVGKNMRRVLEQLGEGSF